MEKLSDMLIEATPLPVTPDGLKKELEKNSPLYEVLFQKVEKYVYTGRAMIEAEDKIEATQKAHNLDPNKDINWKVTTFKLLKPAHIVQLKQKEFELKLKESNDD